MDANERLGIIRAKAGQRPRIDGGTTVRRKGGVLRRGSDTPTCYGVGPRLSAPDRVVDWVACPEGREKEWQPEHRHGPHALTRIAERLKMNWQR